MSSPTTYEGPTKDSKDFVNAWAYLPKEPRSKSYPLRVSSYDMTEDGTLQVYVKRNLENTLFFCDDEFAEIFANEVRKTLLADERTGFASLTYLTSNIAGRALNSLKKSLSQGTFPTSVPTEGVTKKKEYTYEITCPTDPNKEGQVKKISLDFVTKVPPGTKG
ncbi:hypothetical protein P7C73_g2024, partial [Tremellales sp. Uapishka_1]